MKQFFVKLLSFKTAIKTIGYFQKLHFKKLNLNFKQAHRLFKKHQHQMCQACQKASNPPKHHKGNFIFLKRRS